MKGVLYFILANIGKVLGLLVFVAVAYALFAYIS